MEHKEWNTDDRKTPLHDRTPFQSRLESSRTHRHKFARVGTIQTKLDTSGYLSPGSGNSICIMNNI
jgi:hypothetical protein